LRGERRRGKPNSGKVSLQEGEREGKKRGTLPLISLQQKGKKKTGKKKKGG